MIVPSVFVFSGGSEEALNQGPSLMFITLPKVFEDMGFGPLDFVTILGLGLLDFFDFISNSILMPIVALLTCISIGFFIKPQVIYDEVELNGEFKEKKFYTVMLKCLNVTVIILLV